MPCKHILEIQEMLGQSWLFCKDTTPHEAFNSVKTRICEKTNACNCENEDDIRQLRNRIRELESNNNNELILRRNVESDLSTVQRERDNWRSNSWSLQSTNSRLQTERDGLKDQVREKNELIKSVEVVLRTTQNQLTTVQNQLTTKNTEYDDLNCRFNALQIEDNNKDNEISSLKEELESLQNVDIRYKERKLDELVRNSGLNRARVTNLRDAYEKLYKRDDVVNAKSEIETIKNEFFQTNVAINDLHKIYKICEKIAELKVKQEKLREQQQQYEARQEQQTH